MLRGMANTDLAALSQGDNALSQEDVLAMLKDHSLAQDHIERLEGQLKALDPAHWDLLKSKMQQLAHYMMTKEAGRNLLRNAEAVARLLDERT